MKGCSLFSKKLKTCTQHHESKVNTLFFMLESELRSLDNKNRADQLRKLWGSRPGLSAEEGLAIRIETLLTKSMYNRQYSLLKQKGETVFVTPYALDKAENLFMPWYLDYILEQNGQIVVKEGKQLMHD